MDSFSRYIARCERVAFDIDPYDAKNVIVGMTRPITGTGFTPGGTKMCFGLFRAPQRNIPSAAAPPGGYFGTSLKAAGYDGVIVSPGAARSPRVLSISRRQIELRDASKVWGKGIRETEDALRKESGRKTRASAPSGRRRESDSRCDARERLQPHSGARFGRREVSKKLKAFVTWGTKRPR